MKLLIPTFSVDSLLQYLEGYPHCAIKISDSEYKACKFLESKGLAVIHDFDLGNCKDKVWTFCDDKTIH